MPAKTSKAFSPAGISSFFEICDRTDDGKPITDLERVGARGGGFGLVKGVFTEVAIIEAEKNDIRVFINGKFSPEAETTKTVAKALLKKVEEKYKVVIRHRADVPIGAGFGTSAGGALGAGFALSKVLSVNLTYGQIGRIAHVAEIKCRTGLGTVGPLLHSGCILTVEPGAPGFAVIERLPISEDYRIVAGVFKPMPTKEVLSSTEKREIVNKWGRKTVDSILAEPSLENFMGASKEFALKTGFATERVKNLMESAEKAGAVGAAQNMVGEAVHALVLKDKVDDVVGVFKKALPKEKILLAKIDFRGAHLVR